MREKKLIKNRTTRKGWVRKLDKIVSEIVILKEQKCVTCGSTSKPTCGHLFTRKNYSTRWDVKANGNCHRQCWPCNYRHEFDPFPYMEWYRRNHGQTALGRLHKRSWQVTHYKDWELERLFNFLIKYKQKYES